MRNMLVVFQQELRHVLADVSREEVAEEEDGRRSVFDGDASTLEPPGDCQKEHNNAHRVFWDLSQEFRLTGVSPALSHREASGENSQCAPRGHLACLDDSLLQQSSDTWPMLSCLVLSASLPNQSSLSTPALSSQSCSFAILVQLPPEFRLPEAVRREIRPTPATPSSLKLS